MKLRPIKTQVILREITRMMAGTIEIPFDQSLGKQAIVLAAGPDVPTPLEAGDLSLVRHEAYAQHIAGNVYSTRAHNIWAVVRGESIIPMGDSVVVRVTPELPEVSPATGIWTPTEAKPHPDTGTLADGTEILFDVRSPQRRISIRGVLYVITEPTAILARVTDGGPRVRA